VLLLFTKTCDRVVCVKKIIFPHHDRYQKYILYVLQLLVSPD